jgi:adenosylhomocysteinase
MSSPPSSNENILMRLYSNRSITTGDQDDVLNNILDASERFESSTSSRRDTRLKSYRKSLNEVVSLNEDLEEEDEISPRLKEQVNKNNFTDFCVKSLNNADIGRKEIQIAEQEMVGLMSLRKRAQNDKPLAGAKIAGCSHISSQSAVLIETLIKLGAEVRWAACNIFSTSDEVAAALAEENIPIFAWANENDEEFWWCLSKTLCINNKSEWKPNLVCSN